MNYKKKCVRCKEYFIPTHGGQVVCPTCKEKEKESSIMDERVKDNNKDGYNQMKKMPKNKRKKKQKQEHNEDLVNPNPEGYNRFKKNPNPKPKNSCEVMSSQERNELAIKLYQASKKFHRLYRSCLARHTFLLSINDKSTDEQSVEQMSDAELLEMAEALEK